MALDFNKHVPRVGIFGRGNIGGPLAKLVSANKLDLRFTSDRNGIYGRSNDFVCHSRLIGDFLSEVEIACLAISTQDDGTIAAGLIEYIISTFGIPVVTCEKGAIGNHFSRIKEFVGQIGFSAVVGGGSLLLHHAKKNMRGGHVDEIHGIFNGTLNFILNGIAVGRAPGQVLSEAIALKYAEPSNGANHGVHRSLYDTIRVESQNDVPLKVAAFWNIVMGQPIIQSTDFTMNQMTDTQLAQVLGQASRYRFIVSIMCGEEHENDPRFCHRYCVFSYKADGWFIWAGWQEIASYFAFEKLAYAAAGVDNGVIIFKGDAGENGLNLCTGPGAGPGATTHAMLEDIFEMLG